MSIDNAEIVRLIADGATRSDGIARMVDAYTEPLYWHIRRMVVVHEDSEDILQEMWVRIFRRLDSFRGGAGELRAWIYSIATNLCLTHLRRKWRWSFVGMDGIGAKLAQSVADAATESAESIEARFQKAILSLPAKQRLVFNLRYYDELAYKEISNITGLSEATLKTNYHYAQQRIKELMTQ